MMEAQPMLGDDDQQEVIYLVVDENPQGQQVTQIVSDGQLLGQQAQIIMQDGKQAVLITEGNQQQVVLLDDEISPEHIQSALQQGAIQQNVLDQSISPIVMSQAPATASTSAMNGGQVQYLVTDNGQILTTMNEIAQPAMPIQVRQQQQQPQLLVTQSGLVRVDGSPRGKRDGVVTGKSLINQAALQEAASRSPRGGKPEEEMITIAESPEARKLQLPNTPVTANSTLREFINQAVDKQISEMVEEDRAAAETNMDQPALQPAVVDIVTEEASIEVQMDTDSKDETETIGFGEEKLEVTQGVEPDSTQPSGFDASNGLAEIEQTVECPMEKIEAVPGVVESSMASVGSGIAPPSGFPEQVMQGDEDKPVVGHENIPLVPQVINVPHATVEIDTAVMFGENEQVDVVSSPLPVTDVAVEVNSDVVENELAKQTSTVIIHDPEEKAKSPGPIPTTVITVISPQSTGRRQLSHKEKQDSESETPSESQSTSPMKSPPAVVESIASRRERRTSKPTKYYGLDVDYEVFHADIYRSYRRESESGEDSSMSKPKKDYRRIVDDSQDSDMQSADEEKSVEKKKRGRPRKIAIIKCVEEPVVEVKELHETEELLDDLIIEVEKKPKQSQVRLEPSTMDVNLISVKSLDDSQDSDMHSADDDMPVKKKTVRGRPRKIVVAVEKSAEQSTEELVIEEEAKPKSEKLLPLNTVVNSKKKTLVSPDYDEILPVEVDKPVKRGRGRPPKRNSMNRQRMSATTNSICMDESMEVESTEASREIGQSENAWSKQQGKSQVVVQVEVHQAQEVEMTQEDSQEEVKAVEDTDAIVTDDKEVIMESSFIENDIQESSTVDAMALGDEDSSKLVVVEKEAIELREEAEVEIDKDKVQSPRKDYGKRRGRPPKKTSAQSEVLTTDDDNVDNKNNSSDGESPRRSSRPKEMINYTENSEEEGQGTSKKSNKLIPTIVTSAQLEEEANKVYTLQKEVTDLKFVNDSLEIRLAQHSGSPEEIRSLQSRNDKLQMRNNELQTKFRNLESSQKIGINIKGMKFSVKKDITSPTTHKQIEKGNLRLQVIEAAEQELKIREILVEKKEMKGKALDRELDERGLLLTKRESRLDRWERKLKSQEKEIEYKEKQVQRFENDFRDLGGSGSPKKNRFPVDLELVVLKKELDEREEVVTQREAAMTAKEKLLAATDKELMALNTELNEKAVYLRAKEASHSSEECSATDTDSSVKSKSIQSKQSKPRGWSPRKKDFTPKSSLLTRKVITSRSSSVSSQDVAASPKSPPKSSIPKRAKLTPDGTPKLGKIANLMTTPASVKRKYTKASQNSSSVSAKKFKVTLKTAELKNMTPLKKYKKKIQSAKLSEKKGKMVTPSSQKSYSRESLEKKSPLKKLVNEQKKTPSLKSTLGKTGNPSLKSPKGEKKTPSGSLKSPLSKTEKLNRSFKSPKGEKKTPSLKSSLKKERKTPSLKSPPKNSGKKTLLKSPVYKSRKSEGASPIVKGQKRKRLSDAKSPTPSKMRRK